MGTSQGFDEFNKFGWILLYLCAVLKQIWWDIPGCSQLFAEIILAMLPRKCHKRQNRFYGGQNGTIETDLQLNVGKSYAFRIQFNSTSKFAVIKGCGFDKIERVHFVFLS